MTPHFRSTPASPSPFHVRVPGDPLVTLPGRKRRDPQIAAAALDAGDAGQQAGVADRVVRELARHGRPGGVFILAADDALHVEPPLLLVARRKAKRLEGHGDLRAPAVLRAPSNG